MNDDGTSPALTPQQRELMLSLIESSNKHAWGLINATLATEAPTAVITKDLERIIQMGIAAGRLGMVKSLTEKGLLH